MIICVKQAFEIKNKNGEKYYAPNGFIGCPPDWVKEHPYFQGLCKQALVTAHIDSQSVDLQLAKNELESNSKKPKK